jgi:hypothetical protein
MAMYKEECAKKCLTRLHAQPPDHFHPTIAPIRVDEDLAAEIVIEMDLIPSFREQQDAGFGGLNPNGMGIIFEEDFRSARIVIEK